MGIKKTLLYHFNTLCKDSLSFYFFPYTANKWTINAKDKLILVKKITIDSVLKLSMKFDLSNRVLSSLLFELYSNPLIWFKTLAKISREASFGKSASDNTAQN